MLLLLAGYRLSGLFFVAPMTSVEARLLAVDRRMFAAMKWTRQLRLQGAGCHAALELAYLSVYAMVPLGALALAVSGASNQMATYWTVVLAACFTSYAMLPWLQTRPPRAIAGVPPTEEVSDLRRGLRRLNLAILRCSSNQVNTIPSGHVAAALAVSLMVLATDPVLGLAFLTLAVAIAVATVVGRYHYTVDSLAGAAVALASWLCLGR
jgi:membrane-associated phospholipid phosphatase